MGSLINLIKEQSASPCIKFLKNYLTSEKIEILKSINEDFLITEETFCSFFLTDENYFNYFDLNKTGVINIFEIFVMIYLFKNDSFKIKLSTLLDLFIISTSEEDYFNNPNEYNNRVMNKYEFRMASDTLIQTIMKIFDIDKLNDELIEEMENYINSVYGLSAGIPVEEIKLREVKDLLEKDDNLFQVFNFVYKKAAEILES